MGWLSRIFKGSDHKVSEGHYYRDDTSYYLPSTSGVIVNIIHNDLEFLCLVLENVASYCFGECCVSCFDWGLNVGCLD